MSSSTLKKPEKDQLTDLKKMQIWSRYERNDTFLPLTEKRNLFENNEALWLFKTKGPQKCYQLQKMLQETGKREMEV